MRTPNVFQIGRRVSAVTAVGAFVLAALLATPIVFAQIPGGGTGSCFRLEFVRICGDADCSTITCSDGTSGPGCTREREPVDRCAAAVAGGKTECEEEGITLFLLQQDYNCDTGTYAADAAGPFVYKTCKTAELNGEDCNAGGPA